MEINKQLSQKITELLEQNQNIIELLKSENEELRTELVTWDLVSNSDDWIEMSAAAKTLNYQKLGRNKIFALLRDSNILRFNNEPYQEYVDRGYFKIIEQRVDLPYGEVKINKKTVISQKGLDYIRKVVDAYVESKLEL
ncbi:MAG: phage antirepressor KilAC domain-containing protein [Spirochaetia bacterium]|nr:phage antirepressor KilAC domain-containing protein [Spirochaetia bacterium]MCF7946870.1 phage antirepressor KilAC domain-containing protein [Spirochaetia bacterium]MCF7953904.1 phage antirepressor KilAC domain-containing protein [Spirochaetales bacterium]